LERFLLRIDGVRLNIRLFMTVNDIQVHGAGVLASKPFIKWEKDRDKDFDSRMTG